MKFSLSLFLMMLSFSSYSGDRLTLYDCNHGQNNRIGELLNTHYQLQRDLDLPRITNFEQEQRLKASGSCGAFEELINNEIRQMQSQVPANAPAPQSRIEPHPRASRPAPQPPTRERREEPRSSDRYEEDERNDSRSAPRREAPPEQRPAPRREAPRTEAPRQQPRQDNIAVGGVPQAPKGILIVTDEVNPRAARIVKDSFRFLKPFSCLNVPVVIHQVSRSEFDCNPHTPEGQVNRIIVCDRAAQQKADQWRKQAKASHVVIVAQSSWVGGNGGVPATVTSSIITGDGPHAAVHELLHTFGFDDTYDEDEEYSVPSGDIMACTGPGCFVGREKWEKIASKFGRRLTADCR